MIACGEPQGSILGPILFNIVINELLTTFKLSSAYEDDTLIYIVKLQQFMIHYTNPKVRWKKHPNGMKVIFKNLTKIKLSFAFFPIEILPH